MANLFDPNTGLPVKPTTAPLNTRVVLYHPKRPEIVVEGKGETDALRRTSADEQIRRKLAEGYTRERGHGQHPHSNDDERIELQKRNAASGDKAAQAALRAKGHTFDAPEEHKNPQGKQGA